MLDDFQLFLRNRLNEPLPGRSAQLKMVPEPLDERGTQRPMEPDAHTNKSSVLMLLFPDQRNIASLIFTLRSHDINHGGQISFPGGRSERGETSRETALREAKEEIGIDPAAVNIVGTLSDLLVDVSNNYVTPVVGFMDDKPTLKTNPDEVDEVFAVPLYALTKEENMVTEQWELQPDIPYKIPFWKVHDVPLWGATAMMLSEFMEIYAEFKSEHLQ